MVSAHVPPFIHGSLEHGGITGNWDLKEKDDIQWKILFSLIYIHYKGQATTDTSNTLVKKTAPPLSKGWVEK